MSYDEYVTYSTEMSELGCELTTEWTFVEPVVKPEVDNEKKIKECVKEYMPSLAKIDRYFYLADLSDDGYLNIDELYQVYN